MSSVMVDELKGINQKLADLRSVMIGNVPTNIGLSGQFRDDIVSVTKASTIADQSSTKAEGSAGVFSCKGYNVVAITTDGTLSNISYRVVFFDGSISAEIEANQLRRWAGQIAQIQVNNDTAESGTTINVHRFLIPALLANQIDLEAVPAVTKPQAFYASKVDYDGTSNFFETDQALGATPTLSMTTTPTTALYARLDTIKYEMTPANAVTYQLYLFEDAQADNERNKSDVFFDSGAAQASGTYYIQVAGGSTLKLPITIKLVTVNTIYYQLDWSGAPGDTTGYIKIYGETLF